MARRSPSQVLASRLNGAKGIGPITPAGRAISSMNSVQHGLTAMGFLSAEESAAEYQACAEPWFATLGPTSPALVSLAHRVADVAFREGRLRRMERQLLEKELDARQAKSDVARRLEATRDALQGLQGLAGLAESVQEAVSVDSGAKLLPAMRHVCDLVAAGEAPVAIAGPLASAVESFTLETIFEISIEAFKAVATACRAAEKHFRERIPALELEVAQERKSLEMTVLVSDSKMIRLIDRHRTRLARELQVALDTYERVRKLAGEGQASGSLGAPPTVELKVVGRPSR